MYIHSTPLSFPQTLVLRYGRFEPEHRRQPTVVEDYSRWYLARLKTLEPILLAQPYLCAGRFTAADISVGYALLLAQHLDLTASFTPSVKNYWQRLQGRDGFIRAMKSQESAAIAQGVSTIPAPDTLP